MLLGTACSDATAPTGSSGSAEPIRDGATAPQAAPADAPVAETPGLDKAPIRTLPQPNEATSSLKPSLARRTYATGSQYAPGPGFVGVPKPAVVCASPPLTTSRSIGVAGIEVYRSGGVSARSPYTEQWVTADVWFYRSNGTAWVAQRVVSAQANLGGSLPPLSATLSTANYYPSGPGAYTVSVRMTWWAKFNGTWVKTAVGDYALDLQSEYLPMGGTTGPGYCRLN
jgi:hypothetical protein